VRADGSATCWGALPSPPVAERFITIEGGSQFACGISVDGTLLCWDGAGTQPELCIVGGECLDLRPPAGRFEKLTVAGSSACAIDEQATLHCWGDLRQETLQPLSGC